MAKLKMIGVNGTRITPHGSGWEVEGNYYASWRIAVGVARELDGKEPLTDEQFQEAEDAYTDHRILESETRR